MRFTSMLAGLVTLLVLVAGLAWGIQFWTANQSAADMAETQTAEADSEGGPEHPPEQKKVADIHRTNPFTLSHDGDQPKAVAEETTLPFGRIALGATGDHDFVIRNDGKAPLKLAKGETTCRCTKFSLGALEIAPGETGSIHLEWQPKDLSPEFAQTATVWTNDPETPKVELKVEGEVVPTILTMPQGVWTVGTLSEDAPTTVKGYVASFLTSSFEISAVESSSEFVTVTYQPFDEQRLKETQSKSGYDLTCTVSPQMPAGSFTETVKLKLSLTEAPYVVLSISGTRTGPFQIIGAGWAQGKHTLHMGRCKSSDGKKFQLSLFATPPANGTLEFGEPQVTPPILNVKVVHDPAFVSAGGRQRYHLNFEAPPGVTPGRWQGDTAIKVTLPCNYPGVESLHLSVEFQAD